MQTGDQLYRDPSLWSVISDKTKWVAGGCGSQFFGLSVAVKREKSVETISIFERKMIERLQSNLEWDEPGERKRESVLERERDIEGERDGARGKR